MGEDIRSAGESVTEVIRGWSTRYSFALMKEEEEGDRTAVTVQFSKPTKEHPIPLDVAVVVFYLNKDQRGITYRVASELYERPVERFSDIWLDRLIESKKKFRGADSEFDTDIN